MKTELQDLKMVIIDEVSMVSSLNLAYTVYWEIFEVQNFHDLGSISLFAKKNFAFHYQLLNYYYS